MRTNKQIRQRLCELCWMYKQQLEWTERALQSNPNSTHLQASREHLQGAICALIKAGVDITGGNSDYYWHYLNERYKELHKL